MEAKTFWTQCMTNISNIVINDYTNSIFLAGYFGNQHGNDLDSFIVFKEQNMDVVYNFLTDIREKIIIPFEKVGKLVLPFRYATSKPFLPYIKHNLEAKPKDFEVLPLHFLIFPDIKSLLDWEDHEIIRQILRDINKEDKIWVGGENEINIIQSYLKERNYNERKLKYEELLYSAFQNATLNALNGAIERSIEQSSYAIRYLALDEATKKFGKIPNDKKGILDYMQSQHLPGTDFIFKKGISQDIAPKEIANIFNYWRPVFKLGEVPKIKRIDKIREFCKGLRSPLLILDETKIKDNIKSVAKAFSKLNLPVEICYAIKANPIVPLIQIISNYNYGGLCATSYSDIAALRRIDVNPDLVNVHLSYPDDDLLLEVINSKYRLVIAEETTYKRIIELSKKKLFDIDSLKIFIRIKPHVANRLGYHRFGIKSESVPKVIKFFKKHSVNILGFAIHANAASTDPKLWAQSLFPLIDLVENQWYDNFNQPPSLILGGGIATAETLLKQGIKIESFSIEVGKILDKTRIASLIIETGRYIVGDAGLVYTKIKGINPPKEINTPKTLIVDAGSNFLIPIDSADFSFHDIKNEEDNDPKEPYFIADAWSSYGVYGRSLLTSNKKVGDNILIGNAGAYTYSMASNSGDGIPPYRILRNKVEFPAMISSFHFVQSEDYLYAKYELDRPLLNKILIRVKDLLSSKKELKILDVGCGTGAYLKHILEAGFEKKFQLISYFGVDISAPLINYAKKSWREWKNNNKTANISIRFQVGSVYELTEFVSPEEFDLVVGLSLLEYTDADQAIQQLCQVTKKRGLIHLPINYDAETQFEPTFDRKLEQKIIQLFNSQFIPNPYCGRELYNKLETAKLEILDYSLDDWIIKPHKYSNSGINYEPYEELFLLKVIDAIKKIETNNLLNESEKREWIHFRLSQIKRGQLLFICRQSSILAQK